MTTTPVEVSATKAPTETATAPRTANYDYPLTMNRCQMCNDKIHTMCYLGTGVCSLKCQKARDGDN